MALIWQLFELPENRRFSHAFGDITGTCMLPKRNVYSWLIGNSRLNAHTTVYVLSQSSFPEESSFDPNITTPQIIMARDS